MPHSAMRERSGSHSATLGSCKLNGYWPGLDDKEEARLLIREGRAWKLSGSIERLRENAPSEVR